MQDVGGGGFGALTGKNEIGLDRDSRYGRLLGIDPRTIIYPEYVNPQNFTGWGSAPIGETLSALKDRLGMVSALPVGATTGGTATLVREYNETSRRLISPPGPLLVSAPAAPGGAHFILNNVRDTVTCTAYATNHQYEQPIADFAFAPDTEQVIALRAGFALSLYCPLVSSHRIAGVRPNVRNVFIRENGLIVLAAVPITNAQ